MLRRCCEALIVRVACMLRNIKPEASARKPYKCFIEEFDNPNNNEEC